VRNRRADNIARITANVLRQLLDPAEIVISPAQESRRDDRAPNT